MSDAEDSAASSHNSDIISESEAATSGRFFTVAEKAFLVTLEPAYHQYCETLDGDGPRGLAGVKGDKSAWIIQHAQKPLFKKFKRWRNGNLDLEKARKSIRRHFYNAKKTTPRLRKVPPPKPGKKPRKVDPRSLFADEPENSRKIANVKAKRRVEEEVGHGGLLKLHNEIRNDLYAKLSNDDRQKYVQQAADLDRNNLSKPGAADIDRNQMQLADNVLDALSALGGDQWGQHGEFAFYVVGAYKNSGGQMRMFSLSGGPKKAEKYSFSDHPDFDESLTKGPFSSWAADVLSCSSRKQSKGKERAKDLDLDLRLDGSALPLLPDVDSPEEIPIDVVRRLLVGYTRISWQCELDRVGTETGTDMANVPVPWDALHSGHAGLYLSDFDVIHRCITSGDLDANRCSDEDARLLFEMIIESQKHHIRRMDFLMTDTVRALLVVQHGLEDDENVPELHDDYMSEKTHDEEDMSDEPDQSADEGDDEHEEGDQGDIECDAAVTSTSAVVSTQPFASTLKSIKAQASAAVSTPPTTNAEKSMPSATVSDPLATSQKASTAVSTNTASGTTRPKKPKASAKATSSAKAKKSDVTAAMDAMSNTTAGADTDPTTKVKTPKVKTTSTAKAKKRKASKAIARGSTTKKRGPAADDGTNDLPRPSVKRARIAWQDILAPRETSHRIHATSYSNRGVTVRHKEG